MSEQQPISFSVPEAGFDLSLLPESARKPGSEVFRDAVTAYYKDAYREAGGRVDVAFSEGQIEVDWHPQADQLSSSASIAEHLEAGRYAEAIPLLRTRLQLEPEHIESLYNLGMVYSNLQQLEQALELLRKAVELDPGFANAQVALGVAAIRAGDIDMAQGPLEKAVVLEPRNPFALRTLAQVHLMRSDPASALPHLRNAAVVAPDDPITLFSLAQCILGLDEDAASENEAAELLDRALRLAPSGELAEKIKSQQRKLAARVMRSNASGMPRMDVVMYCSGALEAYAAMNQQGQTQLLIEVAAVGQKGLSINDPDEKVYLKTYRNGKTVSAMQAACILFVGAKLLLPAQDTGLDFEKEYAMAQTMANLNPNR